MWKRSGVRISREWFPRRQYRRCWDNRTIITFYFSLISLKWGGQGIKTDKVFQLTSSVLLAVSDLLSPEKLRKCWNYVRLINAGRAESVHKHFCCSSPCSCLFLVQQRCSITLLFLLNFLQYLVFFPFVCCSHVFLFSQLLASDRERETWYGPSWRYCLLFHNWGSKYRVSNKLETVKLGKSKIRKAIFFCYSEAQVFHYLGCGRIGSLDGKLNCTWTLQQDWQNKISEWK